MIAKVLGDLPGILHMTFDAEGHRFYSLQQQEAIEWRQRRAGIPLADCPAAGDISSIAKMVDVNHSVIRNLWPVEHVKAFGIFPPRKLATVDDHSAQSGPMT